MFSLVSREIGRGWEEDTVKQDGARVSAVALEGHSATKIHQSVKKYILKIKLDLSVDGHQNILQVGGNN